MRILVTGSRNWADRPAIHNQLRSLRRFNPDQGPYVIVHGGCPSGADAIANDFGLYVEPGEWELEVHRADWGRTGKAAGPIRNQFMVDTRPDFVLAFPLGGSRGTRDCIRRAQVARLPMIVTEGEVNLGKEVPVPREGL